MAATFKVPDARFRKIVEILDGDAGMIEMIDELEIRGGGVGLFQGCAAGDSAMAVLIKVS